MDNCKAHGRRLPISEMPLVNTKFPLNCLREDLVIHNLKQKLYKRETSAK